MLTRVELRDVIGNDRKKYLGVFDEEGRFIVNANFHDGYVVIDIEGKSYRPYITNDNQQPSFFVRQRDDHILGTSKMAFKFLDNRFSFGLFNIVEHSDFSKDFFISSQSSQASIPTEGNSGERTKRKPDVRPLVRDDYSDDSGDEEESFADKISATWNRFIATITKHPIRTIVGLLLAISFLGLLLTNPLLLAPFWQPWAYTLQVFVASLGVGALIPIAIGGSLLLLTSPKWVGNLLQFIGDKIIGGFVNRLLFVAYGIFWELADASSVIVQTKNPGGHDGTYINLIDFEFSNDTTVGYLFWIPLTVIRIPIYLTHWIGKGLDRLGMIISGEFEVREGKASDRGSKDAEGLIESNDEQSEEKTDTFTSIQKMISKADAAIASIPTRIDEAITSRIAFGKVDNDSAVFCPKTREHIEDKYYGCMRWLKDSSFTSTSLKEQLNRRDAFEIQNPKPRQ